MRSCWLALSTAQSCVVGMPGFTVSISNESLGAEEERSRSDSDARGGDVLVRLQIGPLVVEEWEPRSSVDARVLNWHAERSVENAGAEPLVAAHVQGNGSAGAPLGSFLDTPPVSSVGRGFSGSKRGQRAPK